MRHVEWLAGVGVVLALAACSREQATVLPGTVEWDRVAVLAETIEPVREVRVAEGADVKAGDVLLVLDTRRTDAELAAARAERDVARAQLDALKNGARRETIRAARAEAARLRTEAENAVRERDRIEGLRRQELVSESDLDRATSAAQARAQALQSAEARASELENGARPEDIAAASARLAALEARIEALRLARERLTVVAPRDGRVDALPFRVGDQPPVGATLASLLAGDAPYARVFVPATLRASIGPGATFSVRIQGVDKAQPATLRTIRSEPAFTPYYALAGDDASRLVYRAELLLTAPEARQLPAGLPVSAEWEHGAPAR